MIIRKAGAALLCFRQADHARLAGRLAERWSGGSPGPGPREPVLHAIGHHDGGWEEVDRRPVLDPATGLPRTYASQEIGSALAIADRSTRRAADRDPYAGWLVGRHFLSFHETSDHPAGRRWSAAQARRLDDLLDRARALHGEDGVDGETRCANLDGLQLLDALSLALCQAWGSWESRPMAGGSGRRSRYRYRTTRSRVDRVDGTLDPWPFAPERIEDAIPARRLTGGPWSDEEALWSAWESATRIEVTVVLSAGGEGREPGVD